MGVLDRRDPWTAIPQLESRIKRLEETIKDIKEILEKMREEQNGH